jgi:hypothetical protein
MYQTTLFGPDGKRLVVDLDTLKLSDGSRARDYVEPNILYRKLLAEKVPDIRPDHGCFDLWLCLARHRAATVPAPVIHKRQPEVGGNAA